MLAALQEVRQRGVALDDEELASGLRAVAAPIRDFSGRTIAAANVSGTSLHITDERIEGEIIPALVHATRQISSILGYLPS
jgi:IclR family pca regulon transcriptional regulator